MKTKLVSRKAFSNALLTVLLFGISFVSSAQLCPTVTNANPTICADGGGFDFNDLNTYATDGGDGIVWYDMPTGGSAFMPNELVTETTYYAGNNSGTCVSRSSITVDFSVNLSGQNLDRIYCSNENATVQTYIDDVLQFRMPFSGSVEVYNDFELLNQANPIDAIPTGGSTYYIVFVDSGGGCESQLEIGKVGVFSAPADPTPAALQDFCADSNPTVGDLNPGTATTNFNWYAGLDGMGDPIQPAMSLLEPLVDGNTYYIQVEDVFCDSNPIAVTVSINIPVEPGTPGSLIYCSDSLPSSDFNLFDELGGPKDNTGSWSGPIATSNGHLGTVNISTLSTAGTYRFMYTVTAVGVCTDESTSVSITVYETLSSGIPSVLNPASFCEGNLPAAFDLFTLLSNEDPNGLWTEGTTSAGLVVTSSIDLTGYVPGSYSFTYTQNGLPNPCPEESTTVQVTVLEDPNAGIAINQTFCENDLVVNSPFDLFDALDGSQDHDSGVWTDSADVTISNALDITSFTVIGNQKGLERAIKDTVLLENPIDSSLIDDCGHGRVEQRTCSIYNDLSHLEAAEKWTSLKTFIEIESQVYQKSSGKTTKEKRYYISNLEQSAEVFNTTIRKHWAIENQLHWVLDVTFKEDHSKKRTGHAAENFNMIFKTTLMLINNEKSYKKSKKRKRLKALLDRKYREKILNF